MSQKTADQPEPDAAPEQNSSTAPSGADAATPPAPQPKRRRWLRRVLLVLGPLAVAVGAGYYYYTGGRYVGTEDAYIKADKVMVSAEVSGLISEVDVHENQHVRKGDVLFRIDDRPYRIALAKANAALASVRDDLAALEASYHQKVAELALDRINVAYFKKQFERQSKLVKSSASSASKYDSARHDLQAAQQHIRITQQAMAQIRAQLGGDPNVPVEDQPRYKQAMAVRDNAALNLERTVVHASIDGVAGRTPEPGDQVIGDSPLSSPVMSIVADKDVWVEANYKETDLTYVRPGQPVTVQVDTYPGHTWHGTVQSISQASGAVFSVIPPQNASGNWVKVVQRIPVRIAVKTSGGGPMLRAGMSTSVEIDTGHKRQLPGFVQTALAWFGVAPEASAAEAGQVK